MACEMERVSTYINNSPDICQEEDCCLFKRMCKSKKIRTDSCVPLLPGRLILNTLNNYILSCSSVYTLHFVFLLIFYCQYFFSSFFLCVVFSLPCLSFVRFVPVPILLSLQYELDATSTYKITQTNRKIHSIVPSFLTVHVHHNP